MGRRPALVGLALAALFHGLVAGASGQPRGGMAGRWTITLRIDSLRGLASPSTARSLTGTLVVVSVMDVDPPTYRGSYQIPFSTIGLTPDAAPILARRLRDDSVRIVLNPTVDHGHLEMVGGRHRGTIEGRWEWIGDPSRGWGTFTMRALR